MSEYGERHQDDYHRNDIYREGSQRDKSRKAGERRSFFRRPSFSDEDKEAQGYAPEVSRELENSEEPRELQGFTVERAASVIKDLPEDVPQRSAVKLVRQTLAAVGIEVGELERATGMLEANLESRIALSYGRIEELNEKTEEVVGPLQDQIEKARQACDYDISKEEAKISEARNGLSNVDLVRDFFDIGIEEPRSEPSSEQLSRSEEPREVWDQRFREDDTQEMDPFEDERREIGYQTSSYEDADEASDGQR